MTNPPLTVLARRAPAKRLARPLAGWRGALLSLWLTALAVPMALANGAGESGDWQFKSSADKVNQAAVQDMIQKRNMGYYTAPVYTTNIARQINCTQSASSVGNDGNQGAAALSPSTAGSTAGSTGNSNASNGGAGQVASDQGNSGSVGSSVNGNTNTGVSGTSSQALNSVQNNSGSQSAGVSASTGCSFGVVN